MKLDVEDEALKTWEVGDCFVFSKQIDKDALTKSFKGQIMGEIRKWRHGYSFALGNSPVT